MHHYTYALDEYDLCKAEHARIVQLTAAALGNGNEKLAAHYTRRAADVAAEVSAWYAAYLYIRRVMHGD
jgi:hypothetical protein